MSSITPFVHRCKAWQPDYFNEPDSVSPDPAFFIEVFFNFESMGGDNSQSVTSPTSYEVFIIRRDLLIMNSTSWSMISSMLSLMDVPISVQPFMIQKISTFARELAREADNMYRKTIPMVVALTVVIQGMHDELSEALRESMDDWEFTASLVCASKSSIEALEKVEVEGGTTPCVVCLEDILTGSEATHMPCSHVYHRDCIANWLRKSNLCPLCRFQMPVE